MNDRIDAALLVVMVLTFITLLPMAPAIGIYKVAPKGQVTASGTLAGLTINASGAIATYLVIFAALFLLGRPIIGSTIESGLLWNVYGELTLQDGNGKPLPAAGLNDEILTHLTVDTDPRTFGATGTSFRLAVARENGRFPVVAFNAPDRGNAFLNLRTLGPDQATINEWTREVLLTHPVTMTVSTAPTPYSPSGTETLQQGVADIQSLPAPAVTQ